MSNNKTYQKQGNPYKRGNTWTFIYYITDDIDGQKIQKRKGGYKSKKDAEQAMLETNAEILKGQYIHNNKLSLEDYLNKWFDISCKPRLTQNTLNGYKNNIDKHIIPNLGYHTLQDLNRFQIKEFYNKLSESFSARSIQYIHRVLSKALKEAVIDGLINKNPTDSTQRPSVKKYHSTIYNKNQVKELLAVIKNTTIEFPVLVAIGMGLRRGEALALRFSDFDFNNNTIFINQQVTKITNKDKNSNSLSVWGIKELKTDDSVRKLYVPLYIINIIKARQIEVQRNKLKHGDNYKDSDLIYCKENGEFVTPEYLNEKFRNILKENGLKHMRFHDLRHSFATNLLELDIPLKVISNALGHSTVSITADIYCDVLDKKKQVAETMQNAIFTL